MKSCFYGCAPGCDCSDKAAPISKRVNVSRVQLDGTHASGRPRGVAGYLARRFLQIAALALVFGMWLVACNTASNTKPTLHTLHTTTSTQTTQGAA